MPQLLRIALLALGLASCTVATPVPAVAPTSVPLPRGVPDGPSHPAAPTDAFTASPVVTATATRAGPASASAVPPLPTAGLEPTAVAPRLTAVPSVEPGLTAVPSVPAAAPAAATGSPSARPATPAPSTTSGPLALVDAHVHFNREAWDVVSAERALDTLRRAGVARAFVSSTPDDGTVALYARAPSLVVPILRPYRTSTDLGSWTRDGTIVAYLESRYRRGVHRGIGEFHLRAGEARLPVVGAVVAMAVREDLVLHAHADARAVEELLGVDSRARVLWAHAGISESPATIGALLDRYPRLWAELAMRPDVAPGGVTDPAWRSLFLRHADRFLYGTDTYVNDQWQRLPDLADTARSWLRGLPPEVAVAIASANGARLIPPR